jgi:DNA-binding NarL/FixJ family response regulator
MPASRFAWFLKRHAARSGFGGQALKRIKVMVVDDSLQFASAVAQFLACSGSFEVLASAHSGGEALARAGIEQPDLMLIDISMPGMSGLAVASSIKALQTPPKVVMMTLEDCMENRVGAIAAGADAFLPKIDFARELRNVVETLFGAGFCRGWASEPGE